MTWFTAPPLISKPILRLGNGDDEWIVSGGELLSFSYDSPTIEGVLRVQDGEHSLVEMWEELPQGLLKVNVPALVVRLQVLEEVREDVAVPLIEDPVRLLEHKVEVSFGMGKQVCEEFWKGRTDVSFFWWISFRSIPIQRLGYQIIPSNNCAFEWKVACMCWVAAPMALVYVSLLIVHILDSISGVQQVTPLGQIFRWIPAQVNCQGGQGGSK